MTGNWFTELAETYGSPGWKAEQAIRRLDELPPEDLARPGLHACAVTYALLEVAQAITELRLET